MFNAVKGLIKTNLGRIKLALLFALVLGSFYSGWELKSILVDNKALKQKNIELENALEQLEKIRKEKEEIEDAFRDLEKEIDPSRASPLSPPALELYKRLRNADGKVA